MKSLFKKIIIAIITFEARLVLKKYKPKIVGITGSVGKTSTKDALFRVLDTRYYVRKSQKSYNSEIGVPLTILGVESAWGSIFGWLKNIGEGLLLILFKNHYPEWLVLEIGADAPGDIRKTVSWLTLESAVITRIGETPVHVEFFKSVKQLMEEKWSIGDGLKKEGTLILNYDDTNVLQAKEKVSAYAITYGMEKGADILGTYVRLRYEHNAPVGISFNVERGGDVVPITLTGILGKQHVYPALAALAVGNISGVNMVEAGKALSKRTDWAPGRMRILNGIRGTVLIDDSYNSSPIAVEEALRTLSSLEVSGRRVAVLGDMMELGTLSEAAHLSMGTLAAENADVFITVGPRAREAASAAQDAGMEQSNIHSFDDSKQASFEIPNYIKEGDVILVKGSQSPRLERIVKMLLAHPEQATDLLVRQEKEWEGR
jgi:UDP-N-acetylmuramoyl-tripeptide--D-alanyl-D-alanine ligase